MTLFSAFSAVALPDNGLIVPKPFYYIRHAESTYNKAGIICGSIDVPITLDGEMEAEEVAKKTTHLMRDVKIIVASPMLRTRQTAAIFAKYLKVPVVYDDGLRELNMGGFEGQSKKSPDREYMWKTWFQGKGEMGMETREQFRERIAISMNRLLKRYDDVLIVGHGLFFGSMTDILGHYIDASNSTPYKLVSPKNSQDSWIVQNLCDIEE